MRLTTFRSSLALGVAALTLALGAVSSADAVPGSVHATGSPVSLTLIVPLTVPPTETGLLDVDALTRYTAPLGLLTRQLDAVIDTPVAIGLDPMIIASIRVLGSTAPQSALDWLDRLSNAGNEIFALAYADADVAAAAQSDSLDQLVPLGFDFAIDSANFSPPQTATPLPTPTDTAVPDDTTPPPFPTTDDVLAWSYTLANVAWPADDTVTSDDVTALAAVGYRSIILSSSNVSEPAASVGLGGVTGVVSDSSFSALVRTATHASTETELERSLANLDTAIANVASASPGRSLVATLDRHWPFTSYRLGEVIARLQGAPGLRFGSLAEVIARPSIDATVVDKPEGAERINLIRTATTAAADEAAFATVLEDTLQLTAPRRLEYLALLTTAWLSDPAGWTDATGAFLTRSTELLRSVSIAQGSDLVLLSRSTEVRVAVSNALPFPVTVRVTIVPERPVLRVIENNVLLTVEPDATKTAFLPVEAITSGKVTISVTISSPTGVVVDTGFVRADLQAEWETVGTVVVVVLLVLIFGFGITRTVLKRRGVRRGGNSGGPDAADAQGDAAGD